MKQLLVYNKQVKTAGGENLIHVQTKIQEEKNQLAHFCSCMDHCPTKIIRQPGSVFSQKSLKESLIIANYFASQQNLEWLGTNEYTKLKTLILLLFTFKHSRGSVRLTAQCIQVLPKLSLSNPSSSLIFCSALLSSSKWPMWSKRQAHMLGVIPSLSRTFTSMPFSISSCN